MEPNTSKGPSSSTGTKPGNGPKGNESNVTDKAGYSFSSSDAAAGSLPNQSRPAGGWSNDSERHLPPHRPEGVSAPYGVGTIAHSMHSGTPRDTNIGSTSSFGNSLSPHGQVQQQHTSLRFGSGQAQGMFPQNVSGHSMPPGSSFESGNDTRNSPLPPNSMFGKPSTGGGGKAGPQLSTVDKTQNNAKLLNRTGSDVAHGAVAGTQGQRGGMMFQNLGAQGAMPKSGPSPQGARPISQTFGNDMKAQPTARHNLPLSSLPGGQPAPGTVPKPFGTGTLGQIPTSQKAKINENSFMGAPGIPRQMGGPPSRTPPSAIPSNTGTPHQMGRNTLPVNRPGMEQNQPLSTPNSNAPDKGKRPSPNETSINFDNHGLGQNRNGMPNNQNGPFNNSAPVGRQQHPTGQSHLPTQHGPAVRRPLPMVGSQPQRMATTVGAAVASQQPPSSPNRMRNPTPPGPMAFRNRVDDHQQQQPPQQVQRQQPVGHQHAPVPPSAPPQPMQPSGPSMGGMRELRVEDALLYLDEVKREFKDRPAIYNEFLSIMKNFKTQEVDTPGVIARVSKLFRGYNNLILGFNTFLPDGYKISQLDLDRQDAERLAQEAAERKKATKVVPARPGPKPRKPQAPTRPGAVPMQPVPMQPIPTAQQQPLMQQPVAAQVQSQTVAPRQHPPPVGIRGRVTEDTPPMQSPQSIQMPSSHTAPSIPPRPSPPPQHIPAPVTQSATVPPPRPPVQVAPPPPPQAASLPPTQQAPVPQHQAVEFDHAISYVTTIKKRFANDPSTYHSFLEILHTYQKEQRGIKEVLEQVAHLFQDHPDLLKEFTFFLPDAVQEQAKERLHRAAAESESRQAAQRQKMMEQYQNRMGAPAAQSQPTGSVIEVTRRQGQPPDVSDTRRKRQLENQPATIPQPETLVYNSAVERQFFDAAREALSAFTRDGGQAWAEFLKCLDMYAQEILSRSEMLNFIEPLLGKRNNNLFEEFKRILTAAGTTSGSMALAEDSWYSVPLAEIDFSRCRRCSPSYRALPRDYPAHPCSERSGAETKVLNDVWVSLPVGSEESYTFRHMRRNTYEESLFRVEDERFEIDMVIDSNIATLHRLEPIAEEIALLARVDVIPVDLGISTGERGTGLGGKRFQYKFDKSVLGVIHRNAIARIYGDNGKEMLDLMHKNPTVAIPLIVSRMRQKQKEWIKVRSRLNKQWKELAEQNYYKSLDHRSLTWRTVDKRGISTRMLIAEIKDRAANFGREGKEAKRHKLDKAKEEHGTFYEVTVGSKLDQDLDLTYLPKPDRRLFTPHQSLLYSNVSWAQRDAYRILAFALERGQISPADKERCHRLWVEFLGPWFGLSLAWMQKPAATYQESVFTSQKLSAEATVVSEDDEEESLDDDPEIARMQIAAREMRRALAGNGEFTDHHPLPSGAYVSTVYGEGKVLEFRKSDHIYKVKLGFGAIGFLRPSAVLCSMLPVENSASTRQLRNGDKSKLARTNDHLVFGTQSLYLFFRLHHLLIQRLNIAKRLAYSVDHDSTLQSLVERIPASNPNAVGKLRYEAYLSLLYSSLDGGIVGATEGGKYEDRVRSLLGHGAYELATMDKLITHIWKDVQTMANDENMLNLVQLYRRHLLAGSFQPEAFRQEAAYISEGEPLFAFQHCPTPDSDESVLHIEYVGVMDDGDEDQMDELLDAGDTGTNKRQRKY